MTKPQSERGDCREGHHERGVCEHGIVQFECPHRGEQKTLVPACCDRLCFEREANRRWREKAAERARVAEAKAEAARAKAAAEEAAKKPRCEICRFAGEQVEKVDPTGSPYLVRNCRRHSPVVMPVHNPNRSWPWVANDEWCGEWEKKK